MARSSWPRFNTAPTPPAAYAACAAHGHGERHTPPSAARTEPNNLRKLSAVIDMPAERAESALGATDHRLG
jgi:hypothetical protein